MADNAQLNTLKGLLGFTKDQGNADLDANLTWILESARERLKILLGGTDPPDNLQYIIIEVAIIRYNKIGSEGLNSHSVEGESLSFTDNDFAGYMDEIEAYLDAQADTQRGRVRFL